MSADVFAAGPARHVELFDFDWRFIDRDVPGAHEMQFDDSGWEKVDLPHDFSIRGTFDEKAPSGKKHGFRPFGVGWYRKSFTTPPDLAGRKMWLHFEGIYRAPKVWINGKLVAQWLNGYMWRRIDVTPHLKPPGETNVVVVRADNSLPDTSRWYTGGGIYRHVWQVITGEVYVVPDGTYITTPKVTPQEAWVNLQTQIRNDGKEIRWTTLVSDILDDADKNIATSKSLVPIRPGETFTVRQQFTVANPRLWDLKTPHLYRVISRVLVDGQQMHQCETPLGIREIRITPNGLFLNGQRVFVKGLCIHHDLGCLGTAAFDRGFERRLEAMKEMGLNAIRLSHNPHSTSVLDLADRMGFLIFDEAFDDWCDEFYTDPAAPPHDPKKSPSLVLDQFNKYAREYLAAFVRRDRNHPSVFVWSVGNEVGWVYRKPDYGVNLYNELAVVVKANDPTRPVTTALKAVRYDAAKGNEIDKAEHPHQVGLHCDVMSANYLEKYFARDRLLHPDLAYISSESGTGEGGRTAYAQMDREHAVGMFYWGGINYIGESYRWPFKEWRFGFIDRMGMRKTNSWDLQTFISDTPTARIVVKDQRPEAAITRSGEVLLKDEWRSHWNFAGYTKKLFVETYTNCEEVELLLNGKSLGVKKREGKPGLGPRLAWEIPKFEPGTLVAIGRNRGTEATRHELKTAGAAQSLRLTVDRPTLRADGQDLAHVIVEVVDADGRLVPDASPLVKFTVSGAGINAGVDNGDSTSDELFQADQRSIFQGRALLVVRSKRQAGQVTVKAVAESLQAAELVLTSK